MPILKKHHIRILAHCINILKVTSADNNSLSGEENCLRKWCDNQSKKFDDQEFSDLLYKQLALTEKKLNTFSQRIGKKIEDLDIEDLVLLVEQS